MIARALVFSAFSALALLGAGCPKTNGDTFVEGPKNGEVAQWMATTDGRLKVPLAAGLSWQAVPGSDALVAWRAPEGPTFAEIAAVDGLDPPFDPLRCATAHKQRISVALAAKGIESTPPEITMEQRHGAESPRLHYAVALVASGNAPPASSLSAWGYFVENGRCLAVGVTTIVKAKGGTSDQPDPEDLQRLERVYGVAMDGALIGK